MTNYTQDMKDFMRKFGLEYKGPPRIITGKEFDFRYNFMQEELNEYYEAWSEGNKVEMLDALVDLAYVVFGTAYLHGFDMNEAWNRVHQANMQKTLGVSKRSQFDVVKPPGWKPPNLEDLV